MVSGVQRLVGGALDSATAPEMGAERVASSSQPSAHNPSAQTATAAFAGGVSESANPYENCASVYSHSSDSSSPVVLESGPQRPSDQPRSAEVAASEYIYHHHPSTQQDRFDSFGRLIFPPSAPLASGATEVSATRVEGELFYLSEREVNRVLAAGFPSFANQPLDEDIIVRAVLHGWRDVQDQYLLDRGWQALQSIDQNVFRDSGVVERMAILNMMRQKLLYQTRANPYSLAPLPSFFQRSSMENSDVLNQTPVIEHFIWPGMRTVLCNNTKKYINNKFSDTFRRSFKFLWPHDISDAYVRDPVTQLYAIAPEFRQRQGDLRSWTMRKEFFEGSRELYQAIPLYDAPLDRALVPAGTSTVRMAVTDAAQNRRGPRRRNARQATVGRVEEQEVDESALESINVPSSSAVSAAPPAAVPHAPPATRVPVPVTLTGVPVTVLPHSSEVENWLGDPDMVPQYWNMAGTSEMDVGYDGTPWAQVTSDYVG